MTRGGYEECSDRPGCFGGDRAAAGKFVCRPQESDGREARGGERSVGTGGCRPATASRLDSQSGGNGKRLRCAGTNRSRRHRQGALRLARRAFSGRENSSKWTIGFGVGAVAGGG